MSSLYNSCRNTNHCIRDIPDTNPCTYFGRMLNSRRHTSRYNPKNNHSHSC